MTEHTNLLVNACHHVWENVIQEHKEVVLGIFGTSTSLFVYKKYKQYQRRKQWNSVGKDVVVIHTTLQGTSVPSCSPFTLKLQTYFRMIEVKYEYGSIAKSYPGVGLSQSLTQLNKDLRQKLYSSMDYDEPIGHKGKFPWITLNGEDYADSTLIMEMIAKKFNKDLSSHLTSEQKAIARTIQVMLDEHVFWGIIYYRFTRDMAHFRKKTTFPLSWRMLGIFVSAKTIITRRILVQGLGRHTHEEITEMIRKDFEALSNILGDRDYLFGDKPCEIDCLVFGFVAQFWFTLETWEIWNYFNDEFRNLKDYTIRMKNKFWPDWDDNLLEKV